MKRYLEFTGIVFILSTIGGYLFEPWVVAHLNVILIVLSVVGMATAIILSVGAVWAGISYFADQERLDAQWEVFMKTNAKD